MSRIYQNDDLGVYKILFQGWKEIKDPEEGKGRKRGGERGRERKREGKGERKGERKSGKKGRKKGGVK